MRVLAIVGAAIVVIVLTISLCGWTPLALLGYVMNSLRSAGNPRGSLSVEVRSDPVVAQPVATSTSDVVVRNSFEAPSASTTSSRARTSSCVTRCLDLIDHADGADGFERCDHVAPSIGAARCQNDGMSGR